MKHFQKQPIPSVSSRPTTPGYNFNNQLQETYDTDQILSPHIGPHSLNSLEPDQDDNNRVAGHQKDRNDNIPINIPTILCDIDQNREDLPEKRNELEAGGDLNKLNSDPATHKNTLLTDPL